MARLTSLSLAAAEQLQRTLSDSNARLLCNVRRLAGEDEPAETNPRVPLSQVLSEIFSEIARTRQWFRDEMPPHIYPELESEIAEYRRTLERLREHMPAIRRELLSERSRLEAERTRLQLAMEWARSSRQSL